MKEHIWKEGGFVYLAQDRRDWDDPPAILWGSAGERPKFPHNAPPGSVQETALAREILRLAEALAVARRGEAHEAEQRDLANEQLERTRDEVRELKDARQGLYARIAAREEENRRLRGGLAQAEHVPGRVLAAVRDGAEVRGRRAALESVLKGLRSEDQSQQRDAIIASVEWMLNENTPPTDPLRGYVVWHRHDGDIVKLVRVSEAEELVPGAVISVSYIPRPGEVS